jgi:hypothetical protein
VIASGSTDWSISAISWIYAHDAAVLERAWRPESAASPQGSFRRT